VGERRRRHSFARYGASTMPTRKETIVSWYLTPFLSGQIERWHQTLKNSILLENYCLPGDHEACIGRFVDYGNHQRYHESLKNLSRPMSTSGAGKPEMRKDQTRHHPKPPLAASKESRLT
jgi:hypothetical protein